MEALAGIGGGERYWVHIPAAKPRAYKKGGLVAAAQAVKGSPMANEFGDSELIHVNKYELEKLREMWGEPGVNPETGLPAYGWFGKILGTVAKIAGTVVLTPVLGPVGAAAAVNAVSTAVSGGDLGDIVKSAGFAAATAGAGQLGANFAPDIGISADVGRAVGAGLGATGAGLVTGQSLEQALTGGAVAGIGTYTTNRMLGSAINNNTLGIGDLYQGLTNIGYDISNATGINLGGGNYGVNTGKYSAPGEEIIVTAAPGTNLTYTGSGEIPPVTSKTTSDQPAPKTDEDGEIIVTAPEGTNLTLGPSIPKITSGIGGEELNFDQEGNPIIVNASDTGPGLTITPEAAAAIQKEVTKDKEIVPAEGEIVVTAPTGPGLTLPTGPTGPTTTTDVSASNPYGDVMPFYPSSPTPVATDKTSPLTPRGGTYDVNPNRTDIFGKREVAGIGFDPFTYGQATGDQPGEFLFFTQNGQPFGISGNYTGPRTAIGGAAGDTGGTTTGGTTGGTSGGTTGTTPPGTTPPAVRAPGFTGVMPNQKVGDKQVVDGKTYVWGGDGVGWQFLATDNNGNQVLMPGNGATNVSSIDSMMKSGVMRPANEAEMARLAEIDRIMAATEAAPTAAAARAINPAGVYFDIDAATAAAINRPELIGTQMSMRDLQEAKLAAEAAQREAIAAQIPTQIAAAQAAPKPGMTAQSYYMDYVTPLASSYFSTGKLDATKARALQQAVEPFVGANDLAGAQNAVNTYLSSAGLVAPAMADGGEVDGDDMAAHLIAYQKGGGHQGPGRVKGIGSGQEDKIPAWLSDGEYVWSAQDVADLGDGSTDEGVRRLDKMRQMVRRRAGRKDVKNIAKPQQGIDTMLKAVGGSV